MGPALGDSVTPPTTPQVVSYILEALLESTCPLGSFSALIYMYNYIVAYACLQYLHNEHHSFIH